MRITRERSIETATYKIEGFSVLGRPGDWFLQLAPLPARAFIPAEDGGELEEILVDGRASSNATAAKWCRRPMKEVVPDALQEINLTLKARAETD